VVAAEVQYV